MMNHCYIIIYYIIVYYIIYNYNIINSYIIITILYIIMLWFMGSQRVRHDWVTELNWTECHRLLSKLSFSFKFTCSSFYHPTISIFFNQIPFIFTISFNTFLFNKIKHEGLSAFFPHFSIFYFRSLSI